MSKHLCNSSKYLSLFGRYCLLSTFQAFPESEFDLSSNFDSRRRSNFSRSQLLDGRIFIFPNRDNLRLCLHHRQSIYGRFIEGSINEKQLFRYLGFIYFFLFYCANVSKCVERNVNGKAIQKIFISFLRSILMFIICLFRCFYFLIESSFQTIARSCFGFVEWMIYC